MSAETKPAPSPEMDRRRFLKTVGVVAGATATAGGVNEFGLYPVGEADAALLAGAAMVGGAVVSGALMYTAGHLSESTTDVEKQGIVTTDVYNEATAVQSADKLDADELQHQVVDAPVEKTPFVSAAYGEMRRVAVEGTTNGKNLGTIKGDVSNAVKNQAFRAAYSVIAEWNGTVEALTPSLIQDLSESAGVYSIDGGDIPGSTGNWHDGWEPNTDTSLVDSNGDPTGQYVQGKLSLSPPTTYNNVEGVEEPMEILGFYDSNSSLAVAPLSRNSDLQNLLGISSSEAVNDMQANHEDHSQVKVLRTNMYAEVLQKIGEGYILVMDDLDAYVEAVNNALHEGSIEAADVLGPNDLANHFESFGGSRMSAELLAVGAQVPADAGYRALVSHPDLESDELWVDLFPQWADSYMGEKKITPGTTIASADYRMAYAGYSSQIDGEYRTSVLPGTSDLEVIDTEGVEGEAVLETPEQSAGTDGRVVVYEGESTPDPLMYPADHSDWQVVIEGAANTSSHPIGDVQTDGDEWYVQPTDLNEGELVEGARIVPSVNYVEHGSYTPSSSVDSDSLKERIDAQNEMLNDLEELYQDASGGGGGSLFPEGPWFPQLPSWAPLAAAGVVGLAVASRLLPSNN